jgi:hypothetical protein
VIDSPYGPLNTTSASGNMSSTPYYQANLSGALAKVSKTTTKGQAQ